MRSVPDFRMFQILEYLHILYQLSIPLRFQIFRLGMLNMYYAFSFALFPFSTQNTSHICMCTIQNNTQQAWQSTGCYGLYYAPLPPNVQIEYPTPNVTIFGYRAFREVIEVNGVIKYGSQFQYKKKHMNVHAQWKGHVRTLRKP